MQTKYLIIGSSHAGLSAADEIRVHDQKGTLTMISMENCLPYSPTILPYIVEGKVEEKDIYLRDEKYFKDNKINFLRGKKVVQVSTKTSRVTLDDGSEIRYQKLLVATGSEPTIPPTPGLKESAYLVLRTMEDAHKINRAAQNSKSAVVMGTGLVGMHAAEGLGKKGLKVELIRGRRRAVLPNYFDSDSGGLIHKVFVDNGISCNLDHQVTQVEGKNGNLKVTVKDGTVFETNMLVVGTGVKSRMDFFTTPDVELDQGILVDNLMRTSVKNVWAAGDVAQATDFFSQKKELNPILPDAFEQGKIAGLSMAGDPSVILAFEEIGRQVAFSYPGGVSMNTFNFYGNRSFALGLSLAEEKDGYEVHKKIVPEECIYQKLVFQDDVLVGAVGINITMDPGVIMNLIRRGIHMGKAKDEFIAKPLEVSRRLMWDNWRGVIKIGR
ncbi:MAG TPA: FAD-dependent oxidoreductase [Thermodesulfobacteriota bacterium]|nr:FAD-dependent oxidoreductase [Thermodesulfobacteriota bacterium]